MQVSTLHVQALIEGLRLCGHDVGAFQAHEGARLTTSLHGFAWIDGEEFERLCLSALEFSGDEAFGLHWGRSQIQRFDFGRSAVYADTLRTGIESLASFQRVLSTRPELVFEERGEVMEFTVHALATSPIGRRMRDEFAVASAMRLFEHYGVDRKVVRAYFAYPAPRYAAEYHRVLHAPVLFGQRSTGFTVPLSAIGRDNSAPNPAMFSALTSATESLLPPPERSRSPVARLRELIEASWPERPQLASMAARMNCSERTLRRALARESTSYYKLVRETQLRRAKRLLVREKLPIKEIAAEVGFQDVKAFQRAFKRETGQTPATYRRASS